MSDENTRPDRVTRPDPARAPDRESVWDRFVDELDRQGQAGSAADVLTPSTLDPGAPPGKRFGDLTRPEIDHLAKLGGNIGRRGDVVKTIWEHTQQQLKQRKRARKPT